MIEGEGEVQVVVKTQVRYPCEKGCGKLATIMIFYGIRISIGGPSSGCFCEGCCPPIKFNPKYGVSPANDLVHSIDDRPDLFLWWSERIIKPIPTVTELIYEISEE